MAGSDYTGPEGNGAILEAAKRLAMVASWKEKPHKLTRGHVEYCELLSRHLVEVFRKLEGLPVSARWDLVAETPWCADVGGSVESGPDGRIREFHSGVATVCSGLESLFRLCGSEYGEIELAARPVLDRFRQLLDWADGFVGPDGKTSEGRLS